MPTIVRKMKTKWPKHASHCPEEMYLPLKAFHVQLLKTMNIYSIMTIIVHGVCSVTNIMQRRPQQIDVED
jgi:hypothetical protein